MTRVTKLIARERDDEKLNIRRVVALRGTLVHREQRVVCGMIYDVEHHRGPGNKRWRILSPAKETA